MKTSYIVNTSYSHEDVELLLKDITGGLKPLDTMEREKKIQGGTHYSEMLPQEYKPSDGYMKIYEFAQAYLSEKTADAVIRISEALYKTHGSRLVLISIARAGLPVGILIKRYLQKRYGFSAPHYGISVIRDKGIDKNAMTYIYDRHAKTHGVEHFQFVDGWIGKGTIMRVLKEACTELRRNEIWGGLSESLAVLADPACLTDLCGTHEDFLLPSACLNSTICGLVSRTVLRDDLIGPDDFHGAVYYEELIPEDRSNGFLDIVTSLFPLIETKLHDDDSCVLKENGIHVAHRLCQEFGVADINLIKPGIGETTRVLLRRVPWKVLVNADENDIGIQHILRLCEEKSVEVERHDLGNYKACGIIKGVSADV